MTGADFEAHETAGSERNGLTIGSFTAVFIVALLLFPSLVWILTDRGVWPWDQALYGENSVDLWQHFVKADEWRKAMLNAFAVKAPGIAWFGQFFVPARHITGTIESALLLSILAQQAITLLITWDIFRILFPDNLRLRFLATVLCASSPLFIGMTHQYFVESLQLLSVTYVYWVAVRSYSSSKLTTLAHLVTAIALAMSAKITSPAYCAFPALIAVWNCFRRKHHTADRCTAWAWCHLILALILFVTAGVWYKRHLKPMLAFARDSASGDVALLYGKKEAAFKTLLYWMQAAESSFAIREILIVVVTLLLSGFVLRHVRKNHEVPNRTSQSKAVLFAAIGHITVMFALFSVSINREMRYLLPLLPSLAIVGTYLVSFLNFDALCTGLITTCAVQWLLVHTVALGLVQRSGPDWDVAQSDTQSRDLGMTHWVKRVQPAGSKRNEILKLISITCDPQFNNRRHVVGVERPWINADTLSFYAKTHSLTSNTQVAFSSLGYAESNTDDAWNRLKSSNCGFFISLIEVAKAKQRSDAFNTVSAPIRKSVMSDSSFESKAFPSRDGILLFRHRSE